MFSLFKHIDIDCVYQLKTSSIFLPVLHVYLLAFLRCLYQSQIITLKQELVPLSIFKICIRYVFSEWVLQFKTFPGFEHIFYNPHLKKIQNIQQTDSSSSPVLIWMFSRNHLLLQSSHLTAFRHSSNLLHSPLFFAVKTIVTVEQEEHLHYFPICNRTAVLMYFKEPFFVSVKKMPSKNKNHVVCYCTYQ